MFYATLPKNLNFRLDRTVLTSSSQEEMTAIMCIRLRSTARRMRDSYHALGSYAIQENTIIFYMIRMPAAKNG